MERIRNKLYLMTCYLFDHIVKPFYYAFLLHIVRVFLTPPHLTSPPLSWRQGKKHLFSQTLLVVIEEWHFELLLFWKSSSKCYSSITTSSVWRNRCVWAQAAQTHFAREGCNVIYITYVTRRCRVTGDRWKYKRLCMGNILLRSANAK